VVRAHLLAQVGISIDDLSASVIAKPAFQQILQELAALATPASGQEPRS
jgi:hypothetical protein